VGELLEGVAAGRARASIKALAALMPRTALLEADGKVREVPAESLSIGSVILVRPGDRIPADGTNRRNRHQRLDGERHAVEPSHHRAAGNRHQADGHRRDEQPCGRIRHQPGGQKGNSQCHAAADGQPGFCRLPPHSVTGDMIVALQRSMAAMVMLTVLVFMCRMRMPVMRVSVTFMGMTVIMIMSTAGGNRLFSRTSGGRLRNPRHPITEAADALGKRCHIGLLPMLDGYRSRRHRNGNINHTVHTPCRRIDLGSTARAIHAFHPIAALHNSLAHRKPLQFLHSGSG
jgi:magnesium-transporting ATPase (P-type)